MRCAGCGAVVGPEEAACGKCGRAVGAPVPPLTAEAFEEEGFARSLRRLGHWHLLFAGLNAALGAIGVFALVGGWTAVQGPWEPWPHPPFTAWTYLGVASWSLLLLRVLMSLSTWGALKGRAESGRAVAIVAGIVAMTQFPIGLMLGAYTIAKFGGSRSASLYADMMRSRSTVGSR